MITNQEAQMFNNLGEYLFSKGELSEQDFDTVIELQKNSDHSLQSILMGLNILSESVVAKALSEYYNAPFVDSAKYPSKVLFADDNCSPEFYLQQKALPIYVEEDQIVLAMADPSDQETIETVQEASGKRVLPRVGFIEDIKKAQDRLFNSRVDQYLPNNKEKESKSISPYDDNGFNYEEFNPTQVIRIPGEVKAVDQSPKVPTKKLFALKIILIFFFSIAFIFTIKSIFNFV